jgi:carboxyl-terminal processing protease
VIELEKGKSVLKLTTGAYCRPSGKNIHRFPDATEEEEWGVLPDDGYQVEQTDADVARIYQRQRHRDLFPAPRASDDGGRPTPSVFQNDVAFSKAIGYLKDQLGKKAKEK